MRFVFKGTLEELKETIRQKAQEEQKEIVVFYADSDRIEIGFCRLGYNAGRFYIAKITQENSTVTLDGETKNVYPNSDGGFLSKVKEYLFAFFLGYVFLEALPFLLWLFLRRYISTWIPLALPFIYMAIRPFFNKRENEKLDKSFVEFMSSFSQYDAK